MAKGIIVKIKENLKSGINIKNIITDEEENILFNYIKELNQTKSFIKITLETGLSREYLRRLMRKYDYTIVNKQNVLRCRKNLFNSISTEEDAYWLGFLYADGYISDQGNLELSLNPVDYTHLLKFADYAGFNREKVIKNQKVGNYCRSRISFKVGDKIKNNLFSMGLIPRKSLVLTYPEWIREDLQKHFIRGYFDGDGCLSMRKPRTKNNIKLETTVSILGTKEFLEGINNRNQNNLKNIRKVNNIFVLSLSCNEAKKFLRYIYEDSTISLDRKYIKYKQI